jgi:hypothetical protein
MVTTRYDVVSACVLMYIVLTIVYVCGTKEPNMSDNPYIICIKCTKYILNISINAQKAVSFMIWVVVYVNVQLYNLNICIHRHK